MKKNRVVRYVVCICALGVAFAVGLWGRRHLSSSLDPYFFSFVEMGDTESVAQVVKRRPEWASREHFYTIGPKGKELARIPLTPLQMAVYGGHVDVVRVLLDAGADPAVDNRNFFPSPLHLAARRGHLEMCRILIEHGGEPNMICETEGGTGEWRVMGRYGRTPMVVWGETDGGYTPLHHAAIKGQHAVVELLLSKGAVPDIQDANGNTPLHLALMAEALDKQAGYLPVIKSLIIEGASVTIRNDRERTPMDEASSRTRVLLVDEGWTAGQN